MPKLQELSEPKCLIRAWLEGRNVKKQSSVSQNNRRLIQIKSLSPIVGEKL